MPCDTTFTSMPVLALNSGRMWPNRPESWVEVVDDTTIDLSCASAVAPPSTAAVAARTSSVRRVSMHFPPSVRRDQIKQLAGDEAAGFLGFRSCEERLGRAALDDAAAMQQHDLAGEAPRLAEIVRRHHDLDAARGDGADDVLDRLGGGRIEARGRLVEKQHLRIPGERARQRQPLLLAAGQLARRAVAEAVSPTSASSSSMRVVTLASAALPPLASA